MLAHIVGVPVEEALPWMVPLVGLTFSGAVALARSCTATRWRKAHRTSARGGAV